MLRAAIVIGLSVLVIGLTLPNAFLPSGGNMRIGIDTHYDVRSVPAGSVPDRAGLRVGDHIEPQSLSVVGRLLFLGRYLLLSGDTVKFVVDRGGRPVDIAIHESSAGTTNLGVSIVKRSSATLFIIVAAVLLLLRPSVMLWGFFLYALGSAQGGSVLAESVGPQAGVITNLILFGVVYSIIGPIGLLLFATHFPERSRDGWRRWIERYIPLIAGVIVLATSTFIFFVLGVELAPVVTVVALVLRVLVTIVSFAALLAGMLRLEPEQHQRLRWVIAGFLVYFAVTLYYAIAYFDPVHFWPVAWTNATWTVDVLNGLVVVVPITVAYAVLKHHVLDINFVIGRGLVYAILTSIAVGSFAFIDWLVGTVLAQTRLAVVAEVATAVAIGFWMHGLHRRVDSFVDSVIFRKRHLAELRLAQVAAGLQYAESYDAIAKLVVCEPLAALGLRGGIFFRQHGRVFRCEAAVNVPGAERTLITQDDPVAIHLHGARGPVFLRSIGWALPGADRGKDALVVALPLFVRHDLHAIALYGGHETGEEFDPDELRTLQSLCVAAASALDHVAAAEMNRLLEEARANIAALNRDVASLRAAAM